MSYITNAPTQIYTKNLLLSAFVVKILLNSRIHSLFLHNSCPFYQFLNQVNNNKKVLGSQTSKDLSLNKSMLIIAYLLATYTVLNLDELSLHRSLLAKILKRGSETLQYNV